MDYTDSRLKRYILSQKNKTELQLYAETGVKQKKKMLEWSFLVLEGNNLWWPAQNMTFRLRSQINLGGYLWNWLRLWNYVAGYKFSEYLRFHSSTIYLNFYLLWSQSYGSLCSVPQYSENIDKLEWTLVEGHWDY